MATKTRQELVDARVERARAEAHELHPGDDITVEVSFYGAELFVDVWKKGENRTVARYVDVVVDRVLGELVRGQVRLDE